MQAVILAAGMGKRLGELTKGNTKCMIEVGGETLISRLLHQLDQYNLSRIVMVVGYKAKELQDYLATLSVKTKIEFVENSVYDKTNNIYSLYLAKDWLTKEDTLLFESDIIMEDAVISKLINNPYPNLALVDKYENWMDGTVVTLDSENRILRFIPNSQFCYEEIPSYYKTVNVYKFSREFSSSMYVPFLEAYCKALGKNEYYEQVLRVITMVDNSEMRALPLSGEQWYEIDDIQDLDIAESIFSVTLAWGRHFMPLTELFFNYFPMYNKFRAVESILVVAEITMPLLGFLALQRLTAQRSDSDSGLAAEGGLSAKRSICIAAGITAGLCLIFALFGGSICSCVSSYDAQWKGQVGNDIYQMIIDQRIAMLKADAWRSFGFIVAAAATLLVYLHLTAKQSNSEAVLQRSGLTGRAGLYTLLGILILADMVPVDRRLFNYDNFVSKKEDARYFAIQPWEEQILKDKSLDYRVLNVAANTFNDSRTSYRLKSIGGYSAAKLRRYQDLIDEHISRNNWQVLNMLNTKYIITRNGVQLNPEAFGNAWFVDEMEFVDTPNQESDALNILDLRTVAVADKKFENILNVSSSAPASIEMTSYAPNRLEYDATAQEDKVCVFSEIYYPHDWHLYIDGEEQPIGRANYTLRAAVIPAGQHKIVMEFVPAALKTDKWCMVILILAIILSLAGLGLPLYGKKLICRPSTSAQL